MHEVERRMKQKLALTVVAAAVALFAAAPPTLAVEHDFHFAYNARAIVSNFDDGGCGPNFQLNPRTNRLVEQRGRFNYGGRISNELKLVTQFDVAFLWGDGFYGKDSLTLEENADRNKGGGLAADTVNLKTDALYVDYSLPAKPLSFKIGLQPFHDAYKATVLLGKAAGLVATHNAGDLQSQLGWFLLQAVPEKTRRSGNFIVLDEKYKVNDTLRVGGSYYAWQSDWEIRNVAGDTVTRQDGLLLHYLGVNAEANFGPAVVDGFFIYQNGTKFNNNTQTKQHVNAFAANVSGRVPVGPGTLRTTFLYNSGDAAPNKGGRNDFTGVVNADGMPENYFYYPEMLLLFINKYAIIDNRNVIHSPNNDGAGVIAGFIGYDHKLSDDLSVSANVGLAAVAKNNADRPGDYIGTELNGEVAYKINGNANLRLQGGYVYLGDYFKGSINGKTPENPYTTRVLLDFYY